MTRSHSLAVVIAVPVFVLAACGGDDSSGGGGSNDGGSDTTSSLDGNAGSDALGDAPANTDGAASDAPASDAPRSDASSDASTDATPPPIDAPDDIVITDSATCNALANAGPSVPETNVAGTVPVAMGGVIAHPAIYWLTGWQNYQTPYGPTGNTRKTAFQFGANVYYKVTADNGAGDENDTRMWSTQGTTLVSTQVCPTPDNLTSEYTVSGNTLTLIAGQLVLTFTKQ